MADSGYVCGKCGRELTEVDLAIKECPCTRPKVRLMVDEDVMSSQAKRIAELEKEREALIQDIASSASATLSRQNAERADRIESELNLARYELSEQIRDKHRILREYEDKVQELKKEISERAETEKSTTAMVLEEKARADALQAEVDRLHKVVDIERRQAAEDIGKAVREYESMAGERNIARQDEEAWRNAAEEAQAQLKQLGICDAWNGKGGKECGTCYECMGAANLHAMNKVVTERDRLSAEVARLNKAGEELLQHHINEDARISQERDKALAEVLRLTKPGTGYDPETGICTYCHGVGACPRCWGRVGIDKMERDKDHEIAILIEAFRRISTLLPVTTSHTKAYEAGHIARYILNRISPWTWCTICGLPCDEIEPGMPVKHMHCAAKEKKT